MKKYTVDEMLEMDSCDNINFNCRKCPFLLKEYNEKYDTWCKALIYCRKNNIDYEYGFEASKIYFNCLRERKLLLHDIMEL